MMRIQAILKRLGLRTESVDTRETMMTPALLDQMLAQIEQTDALELNCDEVYVLLDQFAEMVARGEDAAHLMPLVQKHLDMCPDCCEEYEALLRAMKAPVI